MVPINRYLNPTRKARRPTNATEHAGSHAHRAHTRHCDPSGTCSSDAAVTVPPPGETACPQAGADGKRA